jgi:hypothetical protein
MDGAARAHAMTHAVTRCPRKVRDILLADSRKNRSLFAEWTRKFGRLINPEDDPGFVKRARRWTSALVRIPRIIFLSVPSPDLS